MKLKILLFLICLSLEGVCSEVEKDEFSPRIEHLQVRDGLSSDVCYCILEDKKGYMWFGTEDGLNRYDGYDFNTFGIGPSGNLFISHPRVNCLFQDRNNVIWIGTHGGGLNIYLPEQEKFYHVLHQPQQKLSLSSNQINAITEDENGNIWVGTANGLNRLLEYPDFESISLSNDNKSLQLKFKCYTNDPENKTSLSNNRIFCLYNDSYNNLWIGTEEDGLNILTAKSKNFTTPAFIHYDSETSSKFTCNNIYSLFQDEEGNMWIGTADGLIQVTFPKDALPNTFLHNITFKTYKQEDNIYGYLPSYPIFSILEDQAGNLWLGMVGGGLVHVVRNGNEVIRFIQYKHDQLNQYGIFTDNVYRLYESRNGIIWFASNNQGIGKFNSKADKFYLMHNETNNQNSLTNNVVKAICEDQKGDIWIGYWGGGISCYDPNICKFRHFRANKNDLHSLSSDIVQTICEDQKGYLWIGTIGGGLNMYDPGTDLFLRYTADKGTSKSLNSNDIWSVYPSRDGRFLWIGTYEGLAKLTFSTGRIINFTNKPGYPGSLSFNDVRVIFEDSKGVLWIGTNGGGLDRLDVSNIDNKNDHNFQHYTHDPKNPNSISNNSIYSIFEDKEGVLWVGTLGGGINRFNRRDGTFTNFRKKDGLANDVVKGILQDDQNLLWIATTNGLSRLDPGTGKIQNYSESDGLQGPIFNLGACLKTKTGKMYFGGVNGMNIFFPQDIEDDSQIPQVLITNFWISDHLVSIGEEIDGHVLLTNPISETRELELSYRHKTFSIDFTALSFRSQERNQFAYKLEGVESRWNYTDAYNRSVTYSNLGPGDYTFRVIASNSQLDWNTDGVSLKIHIKPPIWRTNTACGIYLLLFVCIIYFARMITRKRVRLKYELERAREDNKRRIELNQMKLRFFTNVSHEFRTPLTLIINPLNKLLISGLKIKSTDRKRQYLIMTKNANRLLRLINQLLDFQGMEHDGNIMKAAEGDIINSIREATEFFMEWADDKKLEFKINLPSSKYITWYDPDKVEKIIFNLLSNAMKFTLAKGRVCITAKIIKFADSKQIPKKLQNFKDNDRISEVLKITVEDTGCGIGIQDINQIFDRFYQGKNSNELNTLGTGIGLALTNKLVEIHHGLIEVTSQLGIGSIFSVWLPLGKNYLAPDEIATTSFIKEEKKIEHEQWMLEKELPTENIKYADHFPQSNHSSQISNNIKSKQPLILLVEDDNNLLNYLTENFQAQFNILQATNGLTAYKIAKNKLPELIISDIMMPGIDGVELCKKLKLDLSTSHIPVILLTAKSAMEHRLEGLEMGADAYIIKPFYIEYLTSRIHNLLESRHRLKEKFQKAALVQPHEITVTSVDKKFLNKAIKILENHMSDEQFSVEKFAKEICESRVQLYRKMKALTGLSPNEFIRNIRLKRAVDHLLHEGITVNEVMYKVGFTSRSYFNRCFRKQFGSSPMEYVKQNI